MERSRAAGRDAAVDSDFVLRSLSGRINAAGIVRLACAAIAAPDLFACIGRLAASEERATAWRATWVCEKISERAPELLAPHYQALVRRATACPHSGTRRLLLCILRNLLARPVPGAEFSAELLDYCLERISAPQESPGVRSVAVRVAYLLCRREPELLGELRAVLEYVDPEFHTAGVRCAIRNTLAEIGKLSLSLPEN